MTWGQNFTQHPERRNEQVCQIWRRCAPPFFCYLRKTEGGTYVPPPGRARVNTGFHCVVKNEHLPPFICSLLRAEREARSEFFCGLREKSQYARPDPTRPNPTRPDPTRPHHAFERLISLERVDRFTSGLLCSMSPFNKFRI